jgi:hypothetical protein
MSESSGSEVNLKDFGDYYVEFNLTIEKIQPLTEEPKLPKDHYTEIPSPTVNERKRAYNYQKLLREYEIAALDGINRRY